MSRPVVVDWHEMNARIIAYINATTTATITSQYSFKYLDSRFNLIILLWLFYFIIKFTLCGQFFLLCVILVLFLRFQCWNFYLACVDKKGLSPGNSRKRKRVNPTLRAIAILGFAWRWFLALRRRCKHQYCASNRRLCVWKCWKRAKWGGGGGSDRGPRRSAANINYHEVRVARFALRAILKTVN